MQPQRLDLGPLTTPAPQTTRCLPARRLALALVVPDAPSSVLGQVLQPTRRTCDRRDLLPATARLELCSDLLPLAHDPPADRRLPRDGVHYRRTIYPTRDPALSDVHLVSEAPTCRHGKVRDMPVLVTGLIGVVALFLAGFIRGGLRTSPDPELVFAASYALGGLGLMGVLAAGVAWGVNLTRH
jgi:hypothetical protein